MQGGRILGTMAVCLAGVGCMAVAGGIAEGIAETSSHFRCVSSGTGHGLSVGEPEASAGGACRLVAQRSIRMPHFVYLGVDGALRVCGPWPLASRLVVVVEANGGGKQDVWVGRSIGSRLPFPHQSVSIFRTKENQSPLYSVYYGICDR